MIALWAGLVSGLVILVMAASGLVKGASRLALAAGITPIVIGLTIGAFGTSAPELPVSYILWTVLKATGSAAMGALNGILFRVGFPAFIIGLTVTPVLALRKEENGTS